MQSYVVWVRMPNGSIVKDYVTAGSIGDAQRLFESRHGGRQNLVGHCSPA
jgi:hypothetical protein